MLKNDCLKQEVDLSAVREQLSEQVQALNNAREEIRRLRYNQPYHANEALSNIQQQAQLYERQQARLDEQKQARLDEQKQARLDEQQQARLNELENINTGLSFKIKDLKIELKKRESMIQLQKDVIQLLDDPQKTIETSLKEQAAKKMAEIEATRKRVKKTFPNRILFSSGSAEINEDGKKALLEFIASLSNNDFEHIRVEGHTDNKTPRGAKLTNWELSAARAIAVVQFLQYVAKIDSNKLSAVAYGASQPLALNDTEAGRQINRRIELTIYY
jgi:chemotaxis protein MotB